MPQMMPMMWLILMIFMLMIFLTITFFIYFFYLPPMNMKSPYLSNNFSSWNWKW